MSCGSGPSDARIGACERYIAHVDALPCSLADLAPTTMCPSDLATTPCALGAYYDCLAEGTTCRDHVLDATAAADCALDCF